MTYTRFGEFVRILRIQRHQVMGDMAQALGTSVPFLSAVETGKKNVPVEWIEKLTRFYDLDENKVKELESAIEESKTQYKIIASKAGLTQRKAALKFARSFNDIDDETAEKILELLSKKKDD